MVYKGLFILLYIIKNIFLSLTVNMKNNLDK